MEIRLKKQLQILPVFEPFKQPTLHKNGPEIPKRTLWKPEPRSKQKPQSFSVLLKLKPYGFYITLFVLKSQVSFLEVLPEKEPPKNA